jgi:hypothetical protein
MLESMEKCQAKAAENKTRRKEHRVRVKEQTDQCQQLHLRLQVHCNLNLVTTRDGTLQLFGTKGQKFHIVVGQRTTGQA